MLRNYRYSRFASQIRCKTTEANICYHCLDTSSYICDKQNNVHNCIFCKIIIIVVVFTCEANLHIFANHASCCITEQWTNSKEWAHRCTRLARVAVSDRGETVWHPPTQRAWPVLLSWLPAMGSCGTIKIWIHDLQTIGQTIFHCIPQELKWCF